MTSIQDHGMKLAALGEALQDEDTTVRELAVLARHAGLELQFRLAAEPKEEEELPAPTQYVVTPVEQESEAGKYSVLLLLPDDLADNYGQDTYYVQVITVDLATVVELAQRTAAKLHHYEGDPDNYYCLLVLEGHHEPSGMSEFQTN
jgi:hypothetical protein